MNSFKIVSLVIGGSLCFFSLLLFFLSQSFWARVKKFFLGGGFWWSVFFSDSFYGDIDKRRYRVSISVLLFFVAIFFIVSGIL